MTNALPAVTISGLTKRFGFTTALDEIDLRLEQGEFLALFGPNGAGKSTLLRILSTLSSPTEGTVRLLGIDPAKHGEQVRASIGVLSHNPLLIPTLTAYENLKFYAQMFGVTDLKQQIESRLKQVGLFEQRSQVVETFSRGMQQRLAIARAILHSPRILLLDEPFTGLDQDGIALLKLILQDFLQEGKTIIMTDHDFVRGLEFCTKVVIVNHGELMHYSEVSALEKPFEAVYRRYVD
ncbi:MAG: heme ABC exporter ATP-binding protein CcmA [bacterium]|nr:heme ABC exporter ATP-binding protein CcmA [bacterium]